MKPKTAQTELQEVSTDKNRIIAQSLTDLRSMGRVVTDDDVESRINDYFTYCTTRGCRPGVESMALAMGINRSTLYRWSKGIGCSQVRQELVCSAMQYIYSFIEMLGLNGAISPVSMIWLQKQWAGYRENMSLSDTVPEEKNKTIDKQQLIESLGIGDVIDSSDVEEP